MRFLWWFSWGFERFCLHMARSKYENKKHWLWENSVLDFPLHCCICIYLISLESIKNFRKNFGAPFPIRFQSLLKALHVLWMVSFCYWLYKAAVTIIFSLLDFLVYPEQNKLMESSSYDLIRLWIWWYFVERYILPHFLWACPVPLNSFTLCQLGLVCCFK